MTLNEVLVSHQSVEYSKAQVEIIVQKIVEQGMFVKRLASNLDLYRLHDTFGLTYKKDPVAYLELIEVEVFNKPYYEINMIYVIPEYRKTRNVGLFILGMKHVLGRPIILGTNRQGGVVFKDGLDLIKSLIKSHLFTVSKLNLLTGEQSELTLDDKLQSEMDMTYIFESAPPLIVESSLGQTFIFGWDENVV